MRYCISPNCIDRENSDEADRCQSCQTPLLIHHRYYLACSLREEPHPYTEVFLATDVQHPERQKVIKTLISTYPKAGQLFLQEQALLRQFRHPGIPRGEAAFTVAIPSTGKTVSAFVMEKIDGITLEQWLQDYGTFDQQQAVNLLGQMACILDYMHQCQYFHRDIKPSNIMWSHRTGQFVLIDFGSARMIERDTQSTNRQTATMIGTSGYTAPEQWNGEATPQSDFYALGMTLLHLLTGKHPDDLPARSAYVATPKPIVPRLADLLETLIAPNPADRPQTARVLLNHLMQIDPTLTLYTNQSTSASPQTSPSWAQTNWSEKLAKRPWLRRMAWGIGSCVLLGGLSVGVERVSCAITGGSSHCAGLAPIYISSIQEPSAVAPPSSAPIPVSAPKTFADYAQSTQLPLGRWQYGGSTAWNMIQKRIDPRILVAAPHFQIISMQSLILQPTTSKGIEMLIEGKLDFALATRPVNQEEKQRAQAQGFDLKQIPVAYDAVGVVVHPDLDVSGLTLDQLVDIYTGKLTNWREVGGIDLPIRLLNPDRLNQDLGGAPGLPAVSLSQTHNGSTVEVVNRLSDAIQKNSDPTVPTDRGGIYLTSVNHLIEQCGVKLLAIEESNSLSEPDQSPLILSNQCPMQRHQVNLDAIQSGQYPLVRQLSVVVREDGSDGTKAGRAYSQLLLTPEGQNLVQQAGFVPLHSSNSIQ